MTTPDLDRVFASLRSVRVAVLGDFCLDHYLIIDPDRKEVSAETGLPVHAVVDQRYSPGGAGNAAANVAALGVGRVHCLGCLGDDPYGTWLWSCLASFGCDTSGLMVQPREFSTRAYVKPLHGNKEASRYDYGAANRISPETTQRIVVHLERLLPVLDAVILNQQVTAGVWSGPLIEAVNALIARTPEVVWLLDSRHHPDRFRGPILKLNDSEAARLNGRDVYPGQIVTETETRDDLDRVFERFRAPVVITRGKAGAVARDGSGTFAVPGVRSPGETDTVGAGDTFTSALASCLGARLGLETALTIANWAAAVTVRKLRQTGTASKAEIRALAAGLSYVPDPEPAACPRLPRRLDALDATGNESLYRQRLARYVTAMRNETPDRVPIRPFVAEFTATYAGMTCQEVVHDYQKAFDAVVTCARDFDWDAVVPNMVYVWTGLTQAAGLRYYGIPGIGLPYDTGFNYIEPPEDKAFMRADEYDALIRDPTGFLFNTWLPRVSAEVAAPGTPASYRSHLALVKSSMAMTEYFQAFGPQIERLRVECGMPSAIAKSPFDIIADKLRGCLGLLSGSHPTRVLPPAKPDAASLLFVPDHVRPEQAGAHRLLDASRLRALRQSQAVRVALLADPQAVHRGVLEERPPDALLRRGQVGHLDRFRELPARSIVFHVDRDDVFAVKRKLGDRFAISGGVPNGLLSFGWPAEVRAFCRRVIDEVASGGGYIMDAGAIMQNDTSVENLRVLTDTAREFGVYPGAPVPTATPPCDVPASVAERAALSGLTGRPEPRVAAGVCLPWAEKSNEMPPITGNPDLVRRVWEQVDALGNTISGSCC
jgi:rfaE bifunctional protein kinase chain/domain